MTTHNSINAIQLIPFRSRSLYPNDYWKAPTNRKFKFNHPKLNKPPIFPEIHSFPVLTSTSYITSHLHYKSEGLLSLISSRLSNTLILPLTCLGLLWASVLLHPRVSCAPSPQSISHTGPHYGLIPSPPHWEQPGSRDLLIFLLQYVAWFLVQSRFNNCQLNVLIH